MQSKRKMMKRERIGFKPGRYFELNWMFFTWWQVREFGSGKELAGFVIFLAE